MLFFTPQLGQGARLAGHEDVYRVVRVNYSKRVVDLAPPRNESIILGNIPFRDLKEHSRRVTLLVWLKTQFANESLMGRLAMIVTVPFCIGLLSLVELKLFLVPPPEVILKQIPSSEFLANIESVVNKILSRRTSLQDRKMTIALKDDSMLAFAGLRGRWKDKATVNGSKPTR